MPSLECSASLKFLPPSEIVHCFWVQPHSDLQYNLSGPRQNIAWFLPGYDTDGLESNAQYYCCSHRQLLLPISQLAFWSSKYLECSIKLCSHHSITHSFTFFHILPTNQFEWPKNPRIRFITGTTPLLVPIFCVSYLSCCCDVYDRLS